MMCTYRHSIHLTNVYRLAQAYRNSRSGMQLQGLVFWKGDDGYEQARQAAVWNFRKPERYPEVIVQAQTEQDVVDAVALANERGLRVKARGGGHAWSGSSVRSGMLIDLSRLNEVSFDAD